MTYDWLWLTCFDRVSYIPGEEKRVTCAFIIFPRSRRMGVRAMRWTWLRTWACVLCLNQAWWVLANLQPTSFAIDITTTKFATLTCFCLGRSPGRRACKKQCCHCKPPQVFFGGLVPSECGPSGLRSWCRWIYMSLMATMCFWMFLNASDSLATKATTSANFWQLHLGPGQGTHRFGGRENALKIDENCIQMADRTALRPCFALRMGPKPVSVIFRDCYCEQSLRCFCGWH